MIKKQLINKPNVNEVISRWQNPSFKDWQPFKLLTYFKRGLDLSIQVIKGLKVKGLQSYHLSNFENDSNQGGVEPRPNTIAHTLAVMAELADFLGGPLTLTAGNFAAL